MDRAVKYWPRLFVAAAWLRPWRRGEHDRRYRGRLCGGQPDAARHRGAHHRTQDQFHAPASGERIVARGEVVKAGRTLTVVQTDVFTEAGGTRKLIALLVATIMTLEAKGGFSD